MKISVIIPTYNAEKYLINLLETLQQQTITFELIIIDSTSTDNTVQIAQKYTENISLIPHKEFDHGGTRTKAAKLAKGDILIFLTQDALPYDNQSLEKLVEVFKDDSVGAAYGRQIPYEETNIFGKHLRAFNYPEASYIKTLSDKEKFGIKTAFLSDSFAAYRSTALENIDWFKDGLIVGEDVHAGANIILQGHSLSYVADAKVYHSHSYSILQEFKRYFDIGVFHHQEQWLLNTFGKAEGEGGKYVKSEFFYLLSNKRFFYLPLFVLRNGLKYLGYKLGRSYVLLPRWTLPKLSMHHMWWKNTLHT